MLMYFWVHLNDRPNFVVVQNLYWAYLLQDTTNNHNSDCIVLFINLTKSYFIGPVKESNSRMIP